MPVDFFEGFRLEGRIERDFNDMDIKLSRFVNEIDCNKKHILNVVEVKMEVKPGKEFSYYEIRLEYQHRKFQKPDVVFFIKGGYEFVVDEFRAMMYELGGDYDSAEYLRENPFVC